MIRVTDWIALIPPEDKYIAYVGENETVTRQFFLPDVSYRDYVFYLDMAFELSTVTSQTNPKQIVSTQQSASETSTEQGLTVSSSGNVRKESYTESSTVIDCASKTDVAPLAKLMREDGLMLTWTVRSQQTQLPGPLRATLRAVGPNGEVKKSAIMVFIVAPSVAASPAATIPLTEFEQMERAMALALEQAADDTFAAFETKVEDASGALRVYVDEKTQPANTTTFGTVKVVKGHKEAQESTGIDMLADGRITVVGASKAQIDERWSDSAPITPYTLDYAVKSVGDGYYATGDDVAEKTAPATSETYGTVKVAADKDMASLVGGVYPDENNGLLTIAPATEDLIDMRWNTCAPIVPANLEYAVKSVGDGYYAKVGEAGGATADVWELVEEIKVSEEAVVTRKYDTPFKKIIVLCHCVDKLPRMRLTSGPHYWEFYNYAANSFEYLALVGDFVAPGILADVYTVVGNGGSNPTRPLPPIDRNVICNETDFDGFKTDAACKVGTTIKVYGVRK